MTAARATQFKPDPAPGHSCLVFDAGQITAEHGVNRGEALARPDDICPGDIYRLHPAARPRRLNPDSGVQLIALYTLMGDDGAGLGLLLIGQDEALFVLPLSPVIPGTGYQLLRIEPPPPGIPLTDLLCSSLARDTRITLADGSQCPIQRLQAGARVLTRDHGPQPLRWLGRATLRGSGVFAPVVIAAGAMGNTGDLIVSQHHRLFLYRRDAAPTPERLVQARHLINGDTICLRPGGFTDYFCLVFDHHEIIYAEGIPTESLQVSEAVLPRLPAELALELRHRFPGLNQRQHFGAELHDAPD